MNWKSVRVAAMGAAIPAVLFGASAAQPAETGSTLCAAYAHIYPPPHEFGSLTLIHIDSERTGCGDDDLWHFGNLGSDVDGVMWNTCDISWVGGGRSTAKKEGIDCTPSQPD
jgi:hypothetical protein